MQFVVLVQNGRGEYGYLLLFRSQRGLKVEILASRSERMYVCTRVHVGNITFALANTYIY